MDAYEARQEHRRLMRLATASRKEARAFRKRGPQFEIEATRHENHANTLEARALALISTLPTP